MKKFIIVFLFAIASVSCEKYDLETVYFHKTNLELDFNIDSPDDNGGCDCFIYLKNNYQLTIDYIIITYEIQNDKGESVKDYRTGESIKKIKVRNIEPFYVGEDYWTVVDNMIYNSTARFLKILDIEINFLN